MPAPMKVPRTKGDDPLRGTLSIEAYARRRGISIREVRRILGTGRLPFVQIRGQIRVQVSTDGESS